MFGSSILEVAIGLVLVYLLLSLICTAVQESLEAYLKIRASNLEKGLRELLHDPAGSQLAKKLYNHPLIFGSFQGDYNPEKIRKLFSTNLPTYIPAANFAAALIDTIVRGPVAESTEEVTPPTAELTFDSLHAAVSSSKTLNASVQRILLIALDSAQGDLAKVQTNIETWFNNGMDRVSGWYKRRMQLVLIVIGLALAIILNVDSLKVATALYKNDALRAGAVAQAGAVVNNGSMSPALKDEALSKLESLNLPIGWASAEKSDKTHLSEKMWNALPGSFFGWLLTAFAISFGAPFWFDLLNKLTVIRSTIKPLEKIAKAVPEDRQQPSPPSAVNTPTAPVPPLTNFRPHEWANNADAQGGVL